MSEPRPECDRRDEDDLDIDALWDASKAWLLQAVKVIERVFWTVNNTKGLSIPRKGKRPGDQNGRRVFKSRDTYFESLVPNEIESWKVKPDSERAGDIEASLARICRPIGYFVPCCYFPIMQRMFNAISDGVDRRSAMKSAGSDIDRYSDDCVEQARPLLDQFEVAFKEGITEGWLSCSGDGCGVYLEREDPTTIEKQN